MICLAVFTFLLEINIAITGTLLQVNHRECAIASKWYDVRKLLVMPRSEQGEHNFNGHLLTTYVMGI